MSYLIAIDQGTTGTTACLVSTDNYKFIGKVNQEFPQIYPSPGLVEHNLNDIWDSIKSTIEKLIQKFNINSDQIKAIGITNQRETTCAFDNKGVPLANAIVWQDRRTSDYCKELIKSGHQDQVQKLTGLKIDPYFSATKMRWLLLNNEQVKLAAQNDNLKLSTIDSFLLYKLSGCTTFKTEASNASRTLLMDLKSLNWSNQLLELFELSEKYLPTICNSFEHFSVTKDLVFLPDGIPITAILGDQQAALFGQAGIKKGQMKCTYGTGAFILLNTGSDLVYSQNGLLTTVAFQHKGQATYALEGSCYIAGAAVQWLRDNLSFFAHSCDIEKLALQVTNLDEMKHLMFMPFFTGAGSPYWNSDIKGAIIGITRDTTKSHLSLACLDGISLSINDLILAMESDLNKKIESLNVDGGASGNNLLMQIQATTSNLKIIRPKVIETTAYGAALGAAIGLGLLKIDDLHRFWQKDREFEANLSWSTHYKEKCLNWKEWCENHC